MSSTVAPKNVPAILSHLADSLARTPVSELTDYTDQDLAAADTATFAKDPKRRELESTPIAERVAKGSLTRVKAADVPASYRKDLAARIDHTMLGPDATMDQLQKHLEEVVLYGFRAACVMPKFAETASKLLQGSKAGVACVVGFPAGTLATALKVKETKAAIQSGATEIDMVAATGLIADGTRDMRDGIPPTQWDRYSNDVLALATVCKEQGVLLKVILQTNFLRNAAAKTLPADASQAEKDAAGDAVVKFAATLAGKAMEEAGMNGVLKTSDGVYTKADPRDAKVLREVCDSIKGVKLFIKIAGGVETAAQADEFVKVGGPDTIFGTSKGIAVITNKAAATSGY